MELYYETDVLCHHGVLGQKLDIRRFRNEDGTLTEKGKIKAGRDFIVQRDKDLDVPLLSGYFAAISGGIAASNNYHSDYNTRQSVDFVNSVLFGSSRNTDTIIKTH